MSPDVAARWSVPAPYDFFETTQLLRMGGGDPTVVREADGLWRTAHTAEGPATVRLTLTGGELRAEAWGPGAASVMAEVPRWAGLQDAPWQLPSHPVLDPIARRHQGLRAPDTGRVFEAVLCATLQQRVTWQEAAVAWRRLCERHGEVAPGPKVLRLPPLPTHLRRIGPEPLRDLGVGGAQARTIVETAREARRLERAAVLPTDEALALLQQIPGLGPWTAAVALGGRLGRPEPVPLGDFHMPHMVAWALAGEPRGSDARMLELLAPFPGQGARVIRLLMADGIQAPRRGPRMPIFRYRHASPVALRRG